jgi:EmrB/QacA subfamily drug resistance transporter
MRPDAQGARWGTPAARWILTATILGSGLAALDATMVNVALPAIGEEFDASLAGLQWTLNAYSLTLAGLMLVGGSLGDRLGRRRVFQAGVVWFAAASFLCGVSPDITTLSIARGLQGIGGALLTPGSLAILEASFARQDRSRAIGAWSGISGIAAAIGPLLGGWLVDALSWRWIFFINAPVALLVVVVAAKHVPESRGSQSVSGYDIRGAVLGATSLGTVSWALIRAGEAGLSVTEIVLAGLGVMLLTLFLRHERRARDAMLPLQMFDSRQFSSANVVTFAVYGGMAGMFFLLVLYLQQVGGYSPTAAGAALIPVTGLMLVLSSRAGAVAERIGPRLPMGIGPLLMAAGLLLMLRIGESPNYVRDILPAVALFGLGLTATVTPLTATVLAAVDERHSGVASGVNNAVSRTAQLLVVAALPALAGLTGDAYTDQAAFQDGFRVAMVLSAVLVAAGGIIALLTISNKLHEDKPACPASRLDRQLHCAIDGTPIEGSQRSREITSTARRREVVSPRGRSPAS